MGRKKRRWRNVLLILLMIHFFMSFFQVYSGNESGVSEYIEILKLIEKFLKQFISGFPNVTKLFLGLLEIVGVVAVFITLNEDAKIKEAEFLMEYNFHFISSKDLIDFERLLENCYILSKDENKIDKLSYNCALRMNLSYNKICDGKITEQYQQLINYMVYLESFAPLILKKRVKLKDVDDLFGYRYFVAMNNPVIQQLELKSDGQYYLGCFKIYSKWYRYREKRGLEIPLREFRLDKTDFYKKLDAKYSFNGKWTRAIRERIDLGGCPHEEMN